MVATFVMSVTPKKKITLSRWLLATFALSLAMGPGPGVYLINPAEPGVTLFGVPILYAWAVMWMTVMVAVVVVAYWKLWAPEGERE